MTINDHRVVRVHVHEVPIVSHLLITINNQDHHNEITIDRREIMIFMIEEITIVIDRIMEMIIEVVEVID